MLTLQIKVTGMLLEKGAGELMSIHLLIEMSDRLFLSTPGHFRAL